MSAGGIAGQVSDTTNAPIDGALVTLFDMTSGAHQVVGTNGTGGFSFDLLQPGSYELFAEQVGYRPVRLRGIRVSPSRRSMVTVVLRADTLPVSAVDTVTVRGAVLGVPPGSGEFLSDFAVARVPTFQRGAARLLALTPAADVDDDGMGGEDAAQGLPLFRDIAIGGISYSRPRHPDLPPSWVGNAAVPRSAVKEADFLVAPSELEWADVVAGRLAVTPPRGGQDMWVSAFGDVSGGGLWSSRLFDAPGVPRTSWHGGLLLSGPVVRDTAQFAIGVEGERLEQAVARPWVAHGDSALGAIGSAAGVDLSPYFGPRSVRRNWVSGFGRFDWRLGARSAINVWASGGTFDRTEPVTGPLNAPSLGVDVKGTDVTAGATVSSMLGQGTYNELRAGFETGTREFGSSDIPGSFFGEGFVVGGDPALDGKFQRTGFQLRDALHITTGRHEAKLGVVASLATHKTTYEYGRGGLYFTDLASLASGRGAYFQTGGPPPTATFSTPMVGGLVQDQWSMAPGLTVTFGARFDLDFLPESKVAGNSEWLAQTGIASAALPRTLSRWSAILGFDWAPDEGAGWLVHGGGGFYSAPTDPAVLSELIAETGRNTVRRGVGDIGSWPTAPDQGQAPTAGVLLSILGPKYQTPRSAKADFGVSHALGGGGALDVSVNYRHTDFLLRRHDLNRPVGPLGTDQYGRPLYGPLTKEGSVLAVPSGVGRRFSGFDLVSALDPDGYSDYWGVTGSLDRPVGRYLRLLARYTRSQTTDNWLTGLYAGPYAQLSPFPDSLAGQDWLDGTSDFDVPDRVALGFELVPLGRPGLTIAGRYRYESGRPFTPGFRTGVDANGDGSPVNDVAFVDDTLSGMSDLMAQYPCLATQAGQFAKRNSCRDPGIGTFDLRVGLGPALLREQRLELWIEAFNLFDPYIVVRDHALYLVDASQPLSSDGTGRTVVPLVVNPNFGQTLGYRTPGRTVRVGLRLNYW